MQMDEARKLNKKNGDKECDHPELTKEYHKGSATGDFVCTLCGESGYGRDWAKNKKD